MRKRLMAYVTGRNRSDRCNRLIRAVLLFCAGVVMAWDCHAATLFERSREMMAVQEQKASPQNFTFVVLGDSRDDDLVFRKSLELAASFNPLFILHDGDFSGKGSPREVDHFLALVQRTVPGIPLFVVKGNHEQAGPFREKIGPLDYVIESGRLGFKVVVVDNSGYSLKPAELQYLNKELDTRQRLTFVSMHVPPRTERWRWHTFSEGAPELIRLLADRHVGAAFYGHVHLYDRDHLDGVEHVITGGAGAPLVTSGFPGEPVNHIVVVQVKDGVVECRMVRLGK